MKDFATQDLGQFKLPGGFRGRSALVVQIWWFVDACFFRPSPQIAYPFRAWLLRLFGAQVGRHVVIRSSVCVTYPWKVKIGDNAWIGDGVTLYSLGDIAIGANTVISQQTYVCAADHDYTQVDFPIRARPVVIGDEAWIATDVYIAPGVTIGDRAVVGARSSVFKDMPAGWVCVGSPCRPVKARKA